MHIFPIYTHINPINTCIYPIYTHINPIDIDAHISIYTHINPINTCIYIPYILIYSAIHVLVVELPRGARACKEALRSALTPVTVAHRAQIEQAVAVVEPQHPAQREQQKQDLSYMFIQEK